MVTAREATDRVWVALVRRGATLSHEDAQTLRRAEITLHRWAEQECGDGNGYASWVIGRDEDTGRPYREVHRYSDGKVTREAVADREAGALKRVAATCERLGLYWYHQTDPRGCALYVDVEPMTDSNYSNGVACCS